MEGMFVRETEVEEVKEVKEVNEVKEKRFAALDRKRKIEN
jgi:hypothetical protein